MASILGKLDELDSGDGGNNDVPDLLKDYVLGAAVNGERPGKSLWDELYHYYEFEPDENTIADADESVIYLNHMWEDQKYPNGTGYYYIRYNNAGYKILVDYDDNTEIATTTDVIKIYEPNGMEGQIVEYKAKLSDANATDWLVLYDNGNTVDITPVKLDNSWSYTLGSKDPAAVAALPSGSDLERAIWSYNHAVDTLNAYCGTIVTNLTAQAVRSVGAGFGQADTTRYYTSTLLETIPEGSEGTYNGVNGTKVEGRNPGLEGDLSAEQDVVRMSYFSPGNSYETFGYAATDSYYWLASRYMYEGTRVAPNNVPFNVRYVGDYRPSR